VPCQNDRSNLGEEMHTIILAVMLLQMHVVTPNSPFTQGGKYREECSAEYGIPANNHRGCPVDPVQALNNYCQRLAELQYPPATEEQKQPCLKRF